MVIVYQDFEGNLRNLSLFPQCYFWCCGLHRVRYYQFRCFYFFPLCIVEVNKNLQPDFAPIFFSVGEHKVDW